MEALHELPKETTITKLRVVIGKWRRTMLIKTSLLPFRPRYIGLSALHKRTGVISNHSVNIDRPRRPT